MTRMGDFLVYQETDGRGCQRHQRQPLHSHGDHGQRVLRWTDKDASLFYVSDSWSGNGISKI